MEPSGLLADRHGCPAYVCPEMLQPGSYSAEAADLWSLGVILYTLLVGHYPFFDSSTQNLFSKVRSGYYQVPDHVSELARSLISSLLAYESSNRVSAANILEHPWFKHASDDSFLVALSNNACLLHLKDQTVPNWLTSLCMYLCVLISLCEFFVTCDYNDPPSHPTHTSLSSVHPTNFSVPLNSSLALLHLFMCR